MSQGSYWKFSVLGQANIAGLAPSRLNTHIPAADAGSRTVNGLLICSQMLAVQQKESVEQAHSDCECCSRQKILPACGECANLGCCCRKQAECRLVSFGSCLYAE